MFSRVMQLANIYLVHVPVLTKSIKYLTHIIVFIVQKIILLDMILC